ncbi:MAG: Virulence factor family protein [Pedobacter sp.]|jgi:type IV secretory pathway VirJ component|nr:Virulence factor family protein [Pedobacter sp.]
MFGLNKKLLCGAFGIVYIITISSCSILKRNRVSGSHGIQKNDFDLPIVVYPSSNPASKRLVIMLSGDGGWLDANDQLAGAFSNRGFHVIGFNSRSYFWTQKSPEKTAADISLLINHYTNLYKTNRIYLVGYSFGADVAPFVYNRLPKAIKRRVVAIELLSPFATSDFMVHTSDLLNISSDNKQYRVAEELLSIRIPVFCFYGEKESPKALEGVKKRNFILRQVAGDHHYESSSNEKIVNAMRSLRLIRF